MPKLIILSGSKPFVHEMSESLRSPELSLYVVNREDLTWASKELSAAAVLMEVPELPWPDDTLAALTRHSRATGLPVIAVHKRVHDDPPEDAPRVIFATRNDDAEHLRDVVHAFVLADEPELFEIEEVRIAC